MGKVYMKVQISGTRNGEDWPAPGELVNLPDDETATLINAGLASVEKPDLKNKVMTTGAVESAAVEDDSEKAVETNTPAKRAAKKAQ